MKKLYPLLSVLFLIYWGCEDKKEPPTEVTLWGEVYSIENTTNLGLSYSQLTGSIPPEISNLTNLIFLNLSESTHRFYSSRDMEFPQSAYVEFRVE